MRSWDDIRSWRKSKRREILQQRDLLTAQEVARVASIVAQKLFELAVLRDAESVGFYWPFKGELDLSPLVVQLVEAGATAALPVVVEKNQPVEFWVWRPGMKLERGMWDTRVPAVRDVVEPEVLLIPLVGFDEAGHRLGYGGGYYDRTLKAANPRSVAIGVGYETSRLTTIFPQAHDIPMDMIVTEATADHLVGARNEVPHSSDEEVDAPARYASSPCFLHEFD